MSDSPPKGRVLKRQRNSPENDRPKSKRKTVTSDNVSLYPSWWKSTNDDNEVFEDSDKHKEADEKIDDDDAAENEEGDDNKKEEQDQSVTKPV